MEIDSYILNEIQKRVETGSYFTKEELYRLRKNLKGLFSIPYENVIQKTVDEMDRALKDMYRLAGINGLATHINTPFHTIQMYVGESIYKEPITSKTVFDIASITKLFTGILTLRLYEQGFFSLDEKVEAILPRYHLEDYTIYDLLKMSGEIRTIKRIDEAKTQKEAFRYLESAYLYNKDKTVSKYSDIGMMILPFILCKKVKEKTKVEMSYEELLQKFLFRPLHLEYTGYNKKDLLAGTGSKETLVYDPKTRKMGGVSGAAGLFSNGHDFALLGKALFDGKILSKQSLKLLHTNFYGKERGICGIYQKHPNFKMTYVPKNYSERSFGSEGYTGSVVTFDLENKIEHSFLVDVIKEGEKKKNENYEKYFVEFQKEITYQTVLLDCFDHIKKEKVKRL